MKKLIEEKKNRILRNIGLMFLQQDIELLDKHGYNFLYLASGFIAHYNLHGFIAHYGNVFELAKDILHNKSSNQWDNFHKGESDYEYMMQKKEIYNTICEFAEQKFDNIPEEDSCFQPPLITDLFDEEPEWRKCLEKHYRDHINNGNYFNATDQQRIKDLVDITMAYNNKVIQGIGENWLSDDEFLNLEIRTETGGSGTPKQMLNCYRDEIWTLFNSLSDRNSELGIFDDEE